MIPEEGHMILEEKHKEFVVRNFASEDGVFRVYYSLKRLFISIIHYNSSAVMIIHSCPFRVSENFAN